MKFASGLEYFPGFLSNSSASNLLGSLWRELPWKQYEISLFGRSVPQPRLTAWCSDSDVRYQYSGLVLLPTAWHPMLEQLKNDLHRVFAFEFNSVLANGYRTGQDSMGWHADDEPELGPRPLIASLSLGAERRFLVRAKGGGPSRGLNLQHGSLLVMSGKSQHETQHSVPKTRRNTSLRINLTYRLIKTPAV